MKNANSVDGIKYFFNVAEGRWKPSPEALKGVLKANKSAFNVIIPSKLSSYFEGYSPVIGLTDSQIDKFVDDNYSIIFL